LGTPAVRYATPRDFARALSDQLKRQAAEEGVDLDRLRKRVAFERFLVRLFEHDPSRWVLKGGYALELRLGGKARATKDIDLDLPPPPVEDLLDELQEAAEVDLGDHFVFVVSRPKAMRGAPLGSFRFSVEARLDGRPFTGFVLDVGQGDAPLGEAECRDGQADLGFAGIPRARMAVYPLADHFAEKLHAYTRPRETKTRVKDLLDLSLILEELADDLPPAAEMRRTMEATFGRYGTHDLPDPLPDPPEGWREPFGAAAEELGLQTTEIDLAHRHLQDYLRSVVAG
jgi:predicted nucleotidyltransferase component of viral defense system